MPEQIPTTFELCYGFHKKVRKQSLESVVNANAKRRGMTGTLSTGIISKLLESQGWTCVTCSVNLKLGYHVDHILSVSKGGENIDGNVQILCPKCNRQKGMGLWYLPRV